MSGVAGPQLQIHGERVSGQDVRTQNTTAVLAVANILKTSLGPVGLDKVCLLLYKIKTKVQSVQQ